MLKESLNYQLRRVLTHFNYFLCLTEYKKQIIIEHFTYIYSLNKEKDLQDCDYEDYFVCELNDFLEICLTDYAQYSLLRDQKRRELKLFLIYNFVNFFLNKEENELYTLAFRNTVEFDSILNELILGFR